MSWICPRCNVEHSCSCAARTKSGVKGCSSCIGTVKSETLTNEAPANPNLGPTAPEITKIEYIPSNLP